MKCIGSLCGNAEMMSSEANCKYEPFLRRWNSVSSVEHAPIDHFLQHLFRRFPRPLQQIRIGGSLVPLARRRKAVQQFLEAVLHRFGTTGKTFQFSLAFDTVKRRGPRGKTRRENREQRKKKPR